MRRIQVLPLYFPHSFSILLPSLLLYVIPLWLFYVYPGSYTHLVFTRGWGCLLCFDQRDTVCVHLFRFVIRKTFKKNVPLQMSQILFKNMKWSEIRIHTRNIHSNFLGCEAHCSGAHPTFLSRSHPSSPLWFSDLIIPLTLLSTSQTGFSIFYLVFQNQYCWQKCFCLIPHYLCHFSFFFSRPHCHLY